MNRQLPIAVLLIAFAARAQAPSTFEVEESLSIRVPVRAMVEPMLNEVLATQSVKDALREAFVAALPKDLQPVRCQAPGYVVTVVDPEAHAIVRIFFTVEATARPQRTEVTSGAVAQVLRQRLDALLYESAVADCNREFESLDRRLSERLKNLADAEERDAALGSEADGVPDAAIAELRQRAVRLQVDERTEQDVAKGLGERNGSFCTPAGRHVVRAKIGAGAPLRAVFVRRRPTGEVWTPELHAKYPGRDWVLSRILWLSGCEPGRNRLHDVDTMRRYIYIHGSPDSAEMGRPGSHGCIRMRNEEVAELFELVPAYAPVEIS